MKTYIENIEKLEPNSVVVLRLDECFPLEEIAGVLEATGRELRDIEPTVTILAVSTGVKCVEFLPENKMNDLGWYRKV